MLSPTDSTVLSPEMYTSTSSSRSPLARLFNHKLTMAAEQQQAAAATGAAVAESNVRRIEALLEDVKDWRWGPDSNSIKPFELPKGMVGNMEA